MPEKPENRWVRKPKKESIEGLKSRGPARNYWVWGKDGVRRGPASLTADGVRTMEARGARVVELKIGEFYTTELRTES